MRKKCFDVHIMSVEETLEQVMNGKSVIRFGDGEFRIMDGANQPRYQDSSDRLRKELNEVLTCNCNDLVICIPGVMSASKDEANKKWLYYFAGNYKQYKKCSKDVLYGDTCITRCYSSSRMDRSKKLFDIWKHIFENKDILLVEGKYSRTGVGNDLLGLSNSIERIICPNINAFSVCDEIYSAILKHAKGKVVCLAIGPASKPIGLKLFLSGIQVIDIGNIDSEYEWFLMGAVKKERIIGKHTADRQDYDIGECLDKDYLAQIVEKVSV